MCKWVAVVLGEGALGRGADMGEDEPRRRLGGDALQVGAVPGGYGRGEEARRRAKLGVGVEAYAEAIRVILASSCVLDREMSAL